MSQTTKLMKIRKLVKQGVAYGYYAHYKHDKIQNTYNSSELFSYPKNCVSVLKIKVVDTVTNFTSVKSMYQSNYTV